MRMCKSLPRRLAVFVVLSSLLGVSHVSAQTTARVLPSTFAGHASTRTGAQVGSTDGFAHVPSGEVLQEYELVSVETQDYGGGNGAIVYKMKDASGAYGLYSYLRGPDMAKTETTAHSSMSGARALVLVGNYVVDVRGTDLAKHADDVNAIAAAAKAYATEGPLPDLTEHLPATGFIDRSDKYVLGPVVLREFAPLAQDDWLGFYQGAEAEVAKYRVNGRELTLVLADFPTPKGAQKRLLDLQRDLHVNPADAAAAASPVYVRRAVTMLAIVTGAKNAAEANAVLDQIQSGAEVTWSEPTFRFKEPTIGGMIVGAIEGTGVICLFALVAGIGFGGFRLITKRLLPGRVFDRTSTMQVLQLGLGSKPINAEDFYGVEGKSSE
jgi:hypothetical protein